MDNIICSHTLKDFNICECNKCKVYRRVLDSMDEPPEDGTDQARIFDESSSHLIFPPKPGESFEDIMKKAKGK